MVRAGIVGPTGYAGFHAIDILLRHPEVEIVYLGARREERPHIAEIWPALRNRIDMNCSLLMSDPAPAMDAAIVALPHTVAMAHVPGLLEQGIRVVDISADYRLADAGAYKKWYDKDHTDPANLKRAVYGLCELFREEIAGADLVANPGCYPTAVGIALAPLVKSGRVRPDAPIFVDAKSGISGAGKKPRPELHFPEANESLTAYKVGVHQHTGEMVQSLSELAGCDVPLLFVPHLIPMDRGILATCYVPLAEVAGTEELKNLYAEFYAEERFVRLCEGDALPNTKHVSGTNFVDVAVRGFGDAAVVVSAIDNLIKGAAGQAVQNMNIMFGLEESLGLL